MPDRSTQAFRAWFKAEWHQPLLAAAAALGLISSAMSGWWMAGFIAASVVATFVGSARTFKRHSDVLALQRSLGESDREKSALGDRLFEVEKDLANVQTMTSDLLWSLLTIVRDELEMGHDERISVYVHDESLRAFQMLARSSLNPVYGRAGRTVYADHVGVIGDAWSRGEVVECDLPSWDGDGRAYIAANLERFGLPEDECRSLNMKARSLIGIRYPADGGGSRPLGVVVLESMDPEWASDSRIEQLKSARSWTTLRDYLHGQRNDLPLMSGAKGKGF